jgi:hypothetical protein
VCQNCPFYYFILFYEHKEAGGLNPKVDVECRTENTPERLFGRSCACGHMLIIVSFAKAATAAPRKWLRLRCLNRRGKLAALALSPGLLYVPMFISSRRLKPRNPFASKNRPCALAQKIQSFETSVSSSVDTA